MRLTHLTLIICAGISLATVAKADEPCDAAKSAAINAVFAEQLKSLSCDKLKIGTNFGDVALDKESHSVANTCYVVASDEDRVSVHARVACRSSGEAFFFPNRGIEEDLYAKMKIDKQCNVDYSEVEAGGEIGKVIVNTAEFFGAFKQPLQTAVSTVCKTR